MEACAVCDSNQWFIERAWGVIVQHEQYRVVCKQYGHSSAGWSLTEVEAIAAWNKEQLRIALE